jgi:hypothetical protein
MPTNLKKLVRARMVKTGESYSTAAHQVRAHGNTVVGRDAVAVNVPTTRSVADLLGTLHAPSMFGVVTGRLPSIGISADDATSLKQARDRSANPVWFAESGAASVIVTKEQRDALIAAGAADAKSVQMIRPSRNDGGITFAERCKRCDAWISCFYDEREGTASPVRLNMTLRRRRRDRPRVHRRMHT